MTHRTNTELKEYVESQIPGYKTYLYNLKMLPVTEQARAVEKLRAGRRKKSHGYAAELLDWLERNGHVEKEKRR